MDVVIFTPYYYSSVQLLCIDQIYKMSVTAVQYRRLHCSSLMCSQVIDVEGKSVRQVIENAIDDLTKRLGKPEVPTVSYVLLIVTTMSLFY